MCVCVWAGGALTELGLAEKKKQQQHTVLDLRNVDKQFAQFLTSLSLPLLLFGANVLRRQNYSLDLQTS